MGRGIQGYVHSFPITSHPVFLFSRDLQAMPTLGQRLGIDWGEARHLILRDWMPMKNRIPLTPVLFNINSVPMGRLTWRDPSEIKHDKGPGLSPHWALCPWWNWQPPSWSSSADCVDLDWQMRILRCWEDVGLMCIQTAKTYRIWLSDYSSSLLLLRPSMLWLLRLLPSSHPICTSVTVP